MSEACFKCRLRSEKTLNCMLMTFRYIHCIISIHFFLRQTRTKEPIEKGEFLRTLLINSLKRQCHDRMRCLVTRADVNMFEYSYILLINMCVLYSMQQRILPMYMCTILYAGIHYAYVCVHCIVCSNTFVISPRVRQENLNEFVVHVTKFYC
jgi:hypothetical protein